MRACTLVVFVYTDYNENNDDDDDDKTLVMNCKLCNLEGTE